MEQRGDMDSSSTDYPGDTSTTGVVGIGRSDYGVIDQVGDVDWFRVSLKAGQQYRFEIEAGSVNGLFDPQLSVHGPSGELVIRATTGQGFQSKHVEFMPTVAGDYFLAASGQTLVGSYRIGTSNLTTGQADPIAIAGTQGDDALYSTSSNDSIDGGTGVDTVNYSASRSGATIARTATGYTVTQTGETDTLVNVEKLRFSDKTVNLTVRASASNLAAADLKLLQELYVAFFNRVPDADGLDYWIGEFRAGRTITQIADAFYSAGVQYSSLTGFSAGMTNDDFVNVVYRNVLGRQGGADAEGLAYWSNALATGQESKGSLVTSILGSAHSFKGNGTWGWVADLLDNKAAVSARFAVEQGLGYLTSDTSISEGMRIAAAVTATDIQVAISIIGVNDALFLY